LQPMTQFFYFSSEEMSRVPVWVKFPNLPLYCYVTYLFIQDSKCPWKAYSV
jgi:hypothetical protein